MVLSSGIRDWRSRRAIGGFEALGVCDIVYRFTTVVIILMESLWRVSFPAMSRLRETGENALPVVERAAGMAAVVSGLLVVPLAGAASALVPVLFGPHWHRRSRSCRSPLAQ